MTLEKWAEAIALRLQEQATALSHGDICKSLSDALKDLYPGQYCYPCDVYGDDTSGDVVYQCGGDWMRAPYEMKDVGGKRACTIDTAQAVDVLPRTVYDEEADEADHYAAMGESERNRKYLSRFPGSDALKVPFAERFISKDERGAASSGDFAGKGRSFPILKPGDVMAAVRSMGRAGADNHSTPTLKAHIIAIAKRKGWTKYLPKAWQGTSDSSSSNEAANQEVADLQLVESAGLCEQIPLLESARSDYEVKLIAPGKGSSAFYPAEVLKRDGPKVFKSGTQMFWNHATTEEESSRPEGDMDKLAGVLTKDAYYVESHAKGPGLFSRMKVFADYADKVAEKAPHTGLSIRAGGVREGGKVIEGRPVLKEFTHVVSTDFVTRAGAGGMVLTEAARAAEGDNDMDEAAVKKLIAEAQAPLIAENARLSESLKAAQAQPLKGEAIKSLLTAIRLPEAAKEDVTRALLPLVPMTEAGVVDTAKLKPMVEAEAVRVARMLEACGIGGVQGLGAPTQPEPKDDRKPEEVLKESENVFARLMGNEAAAKAAARGRLTRVA